MGTKGQHYREGRLLEHYIGDGAYVYATTAGNVVLFTCTDGVNETNRIVLEPQVLCDFTLWVKRYADSLKATEAAPARPATSEKE